MMSKVTSQEKTPLPAHPEPLISHALQHPLDLDSTLQREHPTPYLQPPPASKDIKQEDFDINPDDLTSDQPRCIQSSRSACSWEIVTI